MPPHRIELDPLPAAVVATDEERPTSPSDRSSLADEQQQLYRVHNRSLQKSPKKVYPRLQTIAQLAEAHVDSMHTGAFVSRSVDRWRDFESQSDNQRVSAEIDGDGSNQGDSSRNGARPVLDDARRAIAIARETGSVVIQSAWRRYTAVSIREKLVSSIWKRQMRVAAWISQHYDGFQSDLRRLDACGLKTSVPVDVPLAAQCPYSRSRVGMHYHLPATILAMWLQFMCAKASGCFLRRSPAILQTIDIPVRRTLRVAARCWRKVSTIAAMSMQCCVRSFFARTLFRRIRGEYLRLRAALRLQGFFRVCLARKLTMRLRRRRAAIAIQCCWRCAQARALVQQQRILCVSSKFWAAVSTVAIERAAIEVFEAAATSIQRVHRGQRARSRVRWLLSVREQKNWLKNPSKGFMLFTEQQYGHAALCLEYCRRQGYVDDLRLSVVSEPALRRDPDSRRHMQPQHLTSGSRMSFSFSSAPTKLSQSSDWLQQSYRSDEVIGGADTVKCLRFWFAYALSHFHAFDASGAAINLERSREGWERFLEVCETFVSVAGEVITALRLQARYHLLHCVFWMSGSNNEEQRKVLELSDQLLMEIGAGGCYESDLQAQLLMTSSMISFELGDNSRSCALLGALFEQLAPQSKYSELEIRFVLALLSCRQSTKSSEAVTVAANHFTRCFQLVELLPGVGYFHGALGSSEAKQQLVHAPVGSFLLHTPADTATDGSGPQEKPRPSGQDVLLKVKLSARPLRVTSLRIKVDADGRYYSKKVPQSHHASLHEFVARLPEGAGVRMENGVRKKRFVDALGNKLAQEEYGVGALGSESSKVQLKLLSWRDWERQIQRELKSTRSRARVNETWAAVCLHVARALECSDAWVFGLCAAKQALRSSRDCHVRASASFVAARCSFHLQRHSEFQMSMRLAHLSSGGDASHRHRHASLLAVRRALSRNVTISKQETFESQLERVMKLERMCLKAWRFDSLSVTMRGNPFSEALLLQRIHTEMYSACADTFFLRSLLKAHVRAYLAAGTHFEREHLRRAVQCVAQLFELFRDHHGDDGRGSQNQLTSLAALTSHLTILDRASCGTWKTATRSGALSVDHLLLLWHRMPFAVCFELAEALYRASASSCGDSDEAHGCRVIDMYESLYGRLRGAKPSSSIYAAFEELILIRLAFLYALRASFADGAARFLRSSVNLVDELLSLRSGRRGSSAATHMRSTSKDIRWPRTLTLPRSLSKEELVFTRGLLREMLEDRKGTPREQRKSWRDYNTLHSQLLATVTHESCIDAERLRSRERSQQPKGVRLYIGRTQDVVIKDLLHSKPCVSVQCEGRTSLNQTPPTWMSLAPSWDEYVEFDVESAKSRLAVSLIDRGKRGVTGAHTIGTVHVYVSELIATPDAFSPGRFFPLSTMSAAGGGDATFTREEDKQLPKLFLGFQVLFQPREPSSSDTIARSKRMCGNWRLSDLRANLHGDLETFVRSRWIWSALGTLWLAQQEYSIASWFFRRAVDAAQEELTSEPHRRRQLQQPIAIQPYIEDLLALATCYKATLSRDHWAYYAAPMVDSADAALQSAILAGDLSPTEPAVRKLMHTVESEKRGLANNVSDSSESLADALRRNTPASSDWVKISVSPSASSSPSKSDHGAYFFNLDTEEYFAPHAGASEPLEFEDKELLKRSNFEAAGQRPHRIVIMSFEMRARVQLQRIDMQQRRALDPFQWTAVFNERRQEMRFFSERLSRDVVKTNARSHRSQQQQPPTYVMLADEYMLYNVLLVQDAFRRFRSRKRSGRRLRGLAKCTCWFARELLAARRRIATRIETKRKQGLNCLHIVVEQARHLRAGDLFTSDPFVLATVLDQAGSEVAKGKTSVRHNTLNPKWNEEFHFRFDWTEFAATADAFDDDESDGDDDANQHQVSIGTLTFEVCDYDIIALRRADKKPRGDSESSAEDDDGDDDPVSTTEKKGDLLGQASILIASLEHGEPTQADLPLRLSPGADDSVERARGTLSVSVHWTHSREFAGLQRASIGVIEASKKPLAKQPLPDALAAQLRVLRTHFDSALEQLSDLASTTLDPLQRLHKRMTNAQAVGRTADEAKVVEQRMLALIKSNLAPKTRSLDERMRVCMDVVERFVQEPELLGLIQEYADSQVTERSLELAAILRSVLDDIAGAAKEVVVSSLQRSELGSPATDNSQGLKQLGSCFGCVFRQRKALTVWRQGLEKMLTTFFVGEHEVWTPPLLQTQTDEIYSTLEAQAVMSGSATGASASGDANPTPPPPQSPAKAQSNAAGKRLERIQKEKRRRQQQQQTK